MEEILARAKAQGIQAEVYRQTSRETSIEYENNRLKRAETVERSGLAVRVIAGGRLGFATSSLPPTGPDLLEQALSTAAFGKEVAFSLPGPAALPEVPSYDPSILEVTPEVMVAYGEEIIDPLRQADPKFKSGVSLVAAEAQAELANTSGFRGQLQKTFFGGSVRLDLIEGENFLELSEGNYSCRQNRDLVPLRDRVLEYVRLGRRNVPLVSGHYPVLFTPTAHLSLLGPILACLNGKAVEKGASPLRGRLGEAAFSSAFTLSDDPLQPYLPASAPYDGEGIPSAATTLIERGTIRSFLVDLDTASALGMKPNGNARRGGWSGPPGPGSSNLRVDPGTESWSRLLAGVEEGLLIHYLMGAGQGNPYGGAINANIMLGFMVRHGEIVGRVKNTMISINVFDLFRSQLAALSADTEIVWGSTRLPYLLADGVAITAKAD